jgi:hypothetical protein
VQRNALVGSMKCTRLEGAFEPGPTLCAAVLTGIDLLSLTVGKALWDS